MNTKEQARKRWAGVAKPLNSLGKLEDLIERIAHISQTADVNIRPRCVLVFCADHGVVAEGVTQSDSSVTALVAASLAEGSANVNLMAKVAGADVFPVDMGMYAEVPGVIDRKIARGTGNMARGPAMERKQALDALQAGMELVGQMKEKGYRLIATGEMGIGNTTASTAMACALLGFSPADITGRGAGLSDAGLLRKQQAIASALSVNHPDPWDAVDVLAKVGGLEIAGMAGAFLGGAKYHVPVIIDGVISAVAALAAARINPRAVECMLPSHMSREPAMQRIMAELGLQPVIDGDLALGEGTGAVALIPLLDMALSVYHGPHTFDELGMAAYTPQEGEA